MAWRYTGGIEIGPKVIEIGEPRFVPALGAATDGDMIMAANVMVRCLNGATYPAQTGPTNW